MDNLVVMALVVSAVGMFLLFVALAFLYGLMYLMTAVLKDPTPEPAPLAEESGIDAVDKAVVWRAAAAAAAVAALARAEHELRSARPSAPGETAEGGAASPWWALHHSRQLLAEPTKRRGG